MLDEMNGPVIETARLCLRPLASGDGAALERHWNHLQVRRFLWDDEPVARATVDEIVVAGARSFAARGFGHFAVARRGAPGLIGYCGLREIADTTDVEILYSLSPEHWGQGLATEAARAVLRFGFDSAGLPEILAGADPPNAASIRVMERLGMKYLRRMHIGGLEAIYYGLRRSDFVWHGERYVLRLAG